MIILEVLRGKKRNKLRVIPLGGLEELGKI